MRFSTESQTGFTKVSWSLIGPSFPESFPKSSLSSSSRGDVLIQSGFLVVAHWEVPCLHWVQWHWCAPHRVHLVWRWTVPEHRFHSLPKGTSPTRTHTLLHWWDWTVLSVRDPHHHCLWPVARNSEPRGQSVCRGRRKHQQRISGSRANPVSEHVRVLFSPTNAASGERQSFKVLFFHR